MLKWNEGNINGTCLVGLLDNVSGYAAAVAAKLVSLGAVDEGPGDKTTYEFRGTFHGAVFTLYDYYGSSTLHIGGRHPDDDIFDDIFPPPGPCLDVAALKAHLGELLS